MKSLNLIVILLLAAVAGSAAALPGDLQAKVDAQLVSLKALSTDARIVSAVKDYNASPPAEAAGMDNAKWKELSVLDPRVRPFTKNALAEYLKTKKGNLISEAFVSGATGGKVAFLSKTSSWSHAGSAKHDVPMTGKTWIGDVEIDESTGVQQVQVGLPILDGGKPIGSIVIGLSVAGMK